MLYLRMAVAAARRSDRETATEFLRRADAAGRELGYDANLWHAGFGPTNVVLHRFSAALDLGDVSFVVDKAPRVSVDHMPQERAVTFHIDLARAFSLAGRDEDALTQLLEAESQAPAMVRHSVLVRETVRELYRRDRGRGALLSAFAQRCRVVA